MEFKPFPFIKNSTRSCHAGDTFERRIPLLPSDLIF